ncbi:MAG: hypothetical protein ACK5X4_00045, partial [Phenylobacterium sp.]
MRINTVGLDADDTLWHNETLFRLTQERFCDLLSDRADPDVLMSRLAEVEARNLRPQLSFRRFRRWGCPADLVFHVHRRRCERLIEVATASGTAASATPDPPRVTGATRGPSFIGRDPTGWKDPGWRSPAPG